MASSKTSRTSKKSQKSSSASGGNGHTPRRADSSFQRQLEANVAYYAQRLDQIEQRLAELDREWDVERAVEANVSVLALAGLVGSLIWRRTGLLSTIMAGLLLQHAFQGRSPVATALRRLGIRTWREIDRERYALKALRGDFRAVGSDSEQDAATRAQKALEAAGFGD